LYLLILKNVFGSYEKKLLGVKRHENMYLVAQSGTFSTFPEMKYMLKYQKWLPWSKLLQVKPW